MKWLVACSIVIALASHAQSKKQPPPVGSQEPFDVTSTNVGPNFKGHNCTRLVTAAKRLKLSKDEFETTQAYEARVRDSSNLPVFGSLTLGSNIAIKGSTPSFKYDPENQLLELNYPVLHSKQRVGSESVNWDVIEILSIKESSYIGSNAYGATTRVSKKDSKVCGAILLWDRSSVHLIRFPLRQVTPDTARELKDNISVFHVGKLAPPFFQEVSSGTTPTRDSPWDWNYSGDGVVMYLNEMWLVNTRTGEVVEKQKY